MNLFLKNIKSAFYKVWEWICVAYDWCEKHTSIVLGAILGVLSVVAAILIGKSREDIKTAKVQVAATKIQIAINDLNIKKAILKTKDENVGEKVVEIDKKIEELDKQLKAHREAVNTMDPEEKLARFKELGF